MTENIKKLIGEVFEEIAVNIESGNFGKKVKIGLTTLGSEHGVKELVKAAEMASSKYKDFEVVLIGPKADTEIKIYEVDDEFKMHEVMEELLDKGEIDGCVTAHYNFPIGVSTVGRVVTPGRGNEMLIATTTGTSSTNRVAGMVLNAIYGIIAAKAVGIKNPSVGILNLDGARQVERALKEIDSRGYKINFSESMRADGGSVMRGNDLLTGTPDVMIADTLTGNLLMKMFSSFATGGDYEASGYGYGPGVGEDYGRLVNIISRASGAPVICEALRYCATCAQNNIKDIGKNEFEILNKIGFNELLDNLIKPSVDSISTATGEVAVAIAAPPQKVVTFSIAGIDILELEDAARELWRAGIYAETGMGCTGPIVLVAEDEGEKAKAVLAEKSYL